MEDTSRTALNDFHLASRKAEEAALRRYQAAGWLEIFVGPLGLSHHPSETEFVSCLRNGLVLCNAINKIQPGAVPKVVESHSPLLTSETQPLPAYQYFENVRNFLLAVEDLRLPAFEASDLERDTLVAASTAKIVDCILALKSYHELKQWGGGNGSYKHVRSPMVSHSAGRIHSQVTTPAVSPSPRRHLDMSAASENRKLEDSLVGAISQCLVDTKENIDQNLLASFRRGNLDSVKYFSKIMSHCLQEQQLSKSELKSILEGHLIEGSSSFAHPTSKHMEKSSTVRNYKCCNSCLEKGNCNHWLLLEVQVKDLMGLKALLSRTKKEFQVLQTQLQSDVRELASQVQELSAAALGYQRVVKDNRNLHNMVQDLKGNIRVYCRIRPAFSAEMKTAIDFIGDDGSLVMVDPLKPHKDARKVFHFNRVFVPTTTQEELFKETQPLIRSVMDGYNVCIFAYGQTGSGKTHTMCGPSGGSAKDRGINFLALNDLFRLSCSRKDTVNYEVQVQMVEIYNEQVRDLLAEDSSTKKLEIRNCTSNGQLSLPDATMHLVKSAMDVLNLMQLGEMNRVVSSTAINDRSSRSHSILTVHVHGQDISGSILRSCLHLVDLAGSERVDKSEVTGDRLKEAQHINKSLSCLGDVITALAQKNSHIPYRNSKLTQLLQDSLGGHAKTLMIAHVSPEADSYGETISTLKFAQRVSTVELGVARLNKESSEVRELREQVESLKKALASKEAHTPQLNKETELRSPWEKPRVMTERTPPRPRRLSIESSGVVKTQVVMNPDNRKGSKTPAVKEKFRTEHTQTRPRRLSLEDPKCGKKDPPQIKISQEVCASNIGVELQRNVAPCPFQDAWKDSSSNSGPCRDAEASTTSGKCTYVSSLTEMYHHSAPRSPNSSARQSRTVGTKSITRTPLVQLPKMPEPPTHARNEVHTVMQSEFGLPHKSQITGCSGSPIRKGSQIRKSLQTIGKMISGSDRRNHRIETQSPIRGSCNNNDGKSPITDNARAQRRQSLTGVQPSGLSRRSSLGGKSTDSYSNETRNAKTPPPVHPSSNMTKRWL